MDIFISWSGEKSKAVANALKEWIPDVLQNVNPWMSESNIRAGARWLDEVGKSLENMSFGIICLTRANATAPWVLFESGAISKSVTKGNVCPYLIDMETQDIPAGPLIQFQSVKADKEGTYKLISSINNALSEVQQGFHLSKEKLQKSFEVWWPKLEENLSALPKESVEKPVRDTDEMIEEILEIVRGISRKLPEQKDFKEYVDAYSNAQEGFNALTTLFKKGGISPKTREGAMRGLEVKGSKANKPEPPGGLVFPGTDD